MPKIYEDKPLPEKQATEQRRDAQTKKTMGVYDRPGRKGPSRGVIYAVIIAILILIVFMLSTGFAKTPALTVKDYLPEVTRTVLNAADGNVASSPLIET